MQKWADNFRPEGENKIMKIEQKIVIKDLTKEELNALETTFKLLSKAEDDYASRSIINCLYNVYMEECGPNTVPLAVAIDLLSAILAHCEPVED